MDELHRSDGVSFMTGSRVVLCGAGLVPVMRLEMLLHVVDASKLFLAAWIAALGILSSGLNIRVA